MNLTWLYVAAIYALAVYIARRMRADFPWRIAAFFYALTFIFLFRPMTGRYVNIPVDILTLLPPWSGVLHHEHAVNTELNDLVMQIVPWAHQVQQAWWSGHLPLWNALSGSGYPLLASAQSSALSPLRILALPLPLGYGFTAEAAMKMLLAMSCMYAFCRRRWGVLPSAAGGVCFAFCTFIQVWLHFPLATAAAWIPAAMLTIDMLFEHVTGRRIAATAAVWSAMLLSGHPETVAHTAFFAALFVLWLLFVERRDNWRSAARRIGALAVAAVLAALIASPFLVPFAEAIRKSKRFQELQAHPAAIGYFSDKPSIIILFQPHFFGHLPEDVSWGPARAESITAFAGVLGAGAWLALLLRAILKRRFRDREVFFVLMVVVVLGIILAWPGISTLFHFLFKFAANARLRLMLCWTVATLTAAIIDVALRETYLYLLIAAGASAAALLGLMTFVDFPNAATRDVAMLGMIPSLAVIAVSLLLAAPSQYRLPAACVLFAAIVAELWSATRTWNPVVSADLMYPSTPLIRFLQRQPKPFRIVGLNAMIFPNTQAVYDLEDIRAHDPMANGRYVGMLRALADYDTEDYFAKWTKTDTTLLDYLNVKYVVAERGVPVEGSKYHVVYEGKDGLVYENQDVLPRFFPVRYVTLEFRHDPFIRQILRHTAWYDTAVVNTLPVDNDQMRHDFLTSPPKKAPDAVVTLTHASHDDYSMRVTAPRYTLVVSSVPYWPGWKVEQNGKRILTRPVNGAFLGFTVPPGAWNVRVYFRPTEFYVAAVVSVLAIASLFVLSTRRLGGNQNRHA